MEVTFVAVLAVVAFAVRVGPRWLRSRAARGLDRERRLLVRQALRLDACPIARLPEGSPARAIGKVRYQDRWLVAPMSKTPSVYCRTVISVLEYSVERRAPTWRPIHEEVDSRTFILRDDSGECLVAPALATHAIAGSRARRYARGKAPDSILEMLERAGLSGSSHGQSILVEETLLPVDAAAAVAGIPRLVAIPGDKDSEHDYRSGPPTMFQFDGEQVELLIADDRRLLRPRSQGRASSEEPLWGSPAVEHSSLDTPAVPVDEFEASVRSGGRRRIMFATVGVALVVVAAIVVKRAMSRPTPLSRDHRIEIEKQIAWSTHELEFPSDCGDRCWRDALAHRREYVPGDEACASAAQLAEAFETPRSRWLPRPWLSTSLPAPFPIMAIELGAELPAQSARTTGAKARLAHVEAALDRATDEQYGSLLERARTDAIQSVEVLVELEAATKTFRTWAYDHATKRVICAGKSVFTSSATSAAAIQPSVMSLRAVRSADARSD